jgi:hypothetical protein
LNSEIEYNQSAHTIHDYSEKFQIVSCRFNDDDNDNKRFQNYSKLQEDDHHHWTVWTYDSFLLMCNALNLNVIDSFEKDDKIGNGFMVVVKKLIK